MEKGISSIISVMLILFIAVGITSMAFMFLPQYTRDIMPNDIDEPYKRSRSCLSIDSIDSTAGNITIRNCGSYPLSDLEVYVNGNQMGITGVTTLEPSQETNVYGLTLETGNEIIVVADYAESLPQIVQAP